MSAAVTVASAVSISAVASEEMVTGFSTVAMDGMRV
jgi:hypothetical protein